MPERLLTMLLTRLLCLQGPFAELDRQIVKFRGLAQELKDENRRYYGDYLSRILFDEPE